MSSTEFTVGLESGRNSSKVLKPPGGGSSDIFGLGSSSGSGVEKEQGKKAATTKSRLFGEGEITPKKTFVRRNPITGEGYELDTDDKKEILGELIDNPESSNEEKITEDSSVSEKACEQPNTEAPPKVVQTSIRVRNPPGGKSSGIF